MRYLLIPVKDMSCAKQRLASLLSQEERMHLAWLMLENTFAAAAAACNADRVAVVTSYEPAIRLARQYGMEIIWEITQISESASVDFGSEEVMKQGATAVLRLPIDLPLLTTEDIEEILSYDTLLPSVVLVPSADGTGTNALLRRPPCLFPSHFGPNSLSLHLAEVAGKQIASHTLNLPRVALDIDTPEDIATFLQVGQGTELFGYLNELNVVTRLRESE